MRRRRCNDPLGVSDHPNLVTDVLRVAAIGGELTRRFRYFKEAYALEKEFGPNTPRFSAALEHGDEEARGFIALGAIVCGSRSSSRQRCKWSS